jgi:membrane protease YdiL (CAAX protease family)
MAEMIGHVPIQTPETRTLKCMQPELGGRRCLRPGRWLPARALGWMAVLICAVLLSYVPGVTALSHALPAQPALKFLARLSGVLVVLGAYTALVRIGEDRKASEIAMRSAPVGLLAGLAVGSILFSLVMAILLSTGIYDFAWTGPVSAWRGAGLAMESGILEELIVRGIILRLLWRAFGPWLALAASAMLFGAGHIGNPGATPFSTACIAIEAGLMLGSFYALTGRLWVSIGVHAGWNFAQGYLFGAAVSGGDFGDAIATSTASGNYPVWLTGGTFGPEASLPALAICTSVGVTVLWLSWRANRFRQAPNARRS